MFIPAAASKRGASRQNPATPFLWGGGILAVMIVGAMLISGGGDDGSQNRNKPAPPKRVETGSANPRVRDAMAWYEAMSTDNRFELGRYTDLQGMRKSLGIDNIDGTAEDLEKRVLDALLAADSAKLIRDTEPTSGQVDTTDAEAETGKVILYVTPDEQAQAKYFDQGGGEVWVWFTFANDRARISRFEVVSGIRERAPKDDPNKIRPSTHEVIGQAQDVKRVYNGVEETVREAEIKALGHLDGTPENVQAEIDQRIAELIDLDAPGAVPNRAAMRLKQIGKPSIPRLLNKFFEIPASNREQILQLRKVCQALEDITGQRFGFNPSMTEAADPAKSAHVEEMRQSALKQWYGWWADNHWRTDYDYAIQKDDAELEAELSGRTPPDKDDAKKR